MTGKLFHSHIYLAPSCHSSDSPTDSLAAWAWANEPFSSMLADNLFESRMPAAFWRILAQESSTEISDQRFIRYHRGGLAETIAEICEGSPEKSWCVISDGRYMSMPDMSGCRQFIIDDKVDLVLLASAPSLLAGAEQVMLTSENEMAGFRMYCRTATVPFQIGTGCAEHILIKTQYLMQLLSLGSDIIDFNGIVEKLLKMNLVSSSFRSGGTRYDLDTPGEFASVIFDLLHRKNFYPPSGYSFFRQGMSLLPHNIRVSGPVLIGDHVTIGEGAVINGPSVICDGVDIAPKAILSSSIVGYTDKQITDHNSCLILSGGQCNDITTCVYDGTQSHRKSAFKDDKPFSYSRFWKRLFDVIFAFCATVILLPLLPIIAAAIKVNSKGPVFFRQKRQGLHGREFYCLKFRTMIEGADQLQQRLRVFNEIGGPQFKMDDDPRVTSVGRYLRASFLDEIPQFINVLEGSMSLVGPRPSPPRENLSCPPWHDARLSVRPGITGLWQVCRTRGRLQDFQEWIYYDTQYVRDISLRLDLWICWRTLIKFARAIVKQS